MNIYAATSCTDHAPGASMGFIPTACAGVFFDKPDPLGHWMRPEPLRARGIRQAVLDFELWKPGDDWSKVEHVARELAKLNGQPPQWIVATPGEAKIQRPQKVRPQVLQELRGVLKMPIGSLVGGIGRYGYPVLPSANDGSMTPAELKATIDRARIATLEGLEATSGREVCLWVLSHWPVESGFYKVSGLPMPQAYADAVLALARELNRAHPGRVSVCVWYGWSLEDANLSRLTNGRHAINWNTPQTWAELADSPVIRTLARAIGGTNAVQ